MPGAWAAKHPTASSAARVAPTTTSTTTRRPLVAANVNAHAPAQRAAINNSTIRRPLAPPAKPVNAHTPVGQVNNATAWRLLAASIRPVNLANANTRAPALVKVNTTSANRRSLAAPSRPANTINARVPIQAAAVQVNNSTVRRSLAASTSNHPSLVQRAAAPIITAPPPKPCPKPLPGVWKTPERRSPLSQKLLRKIDGTRKTLAQKGSEPIVPNCKEEPKYINTIAKQSSPISRHLAPKIEAARLSLIDRAALPYSAPQPKQAPSAKSTLPVWKPKSVQKLGGTSTGTIGTSNTTSSNLKRKGHIRATDDVNERGEASDNGKDERGRRTERTAINRWREPSTDSYISDDGIAFIDYPDPDPFIYDYDFGEGLFGNLFAQDTCDGPLDYPSTDPLDFGYDTDSQEEHSPCRRCEITTLRIERAERPQSVVSISELPKIVGGFESLNQENNSDNFEESGRSVEQLIGVNQPEEENTSESLGELAGTKQQRAGRAESIYSYISESEFQETVGGFNISSKENTSESAEELAIYKEQGEHQSATATHKLVSNPHQPTVEQLEREHYEQTIELEQAVWESSLRLQAAIYKSKEIRSQVITENIKRLEKELIEQRLKEKEARQLVERSSSRLRKAIYERIAIFSKLAAIDLEEKVEKSYARLLAAITAQSVEYQKIVESFETVEKPADITNSNKGKRRESVNPIESSHEQFEELNESEIDYILTRISTSSSRSEVSRDGERSPRSSGEEHSGYNTRPTSAGSVCSVSSDYCISSIVLTAGELQWILNRPEVKHTARARDHRLGIRRVSEVSVSASPSVEIVDGGNLIDGGQESGEESETF